MVAWAKQEHILHNIHATSCLFGPICDYVFGPTFDLICGDKKTSRIQNANATRNWTEKAGNTQKMKNLVSLEFWS